MTFLSSSKSSLSLSTFLAVDFFLPWHIVSDSISREHISRTHGFGLRPISRAGLCGGGCALAAVLVSVEAGTGSADGRSRTCNAAAQLGNVALRSGSGAQRDTTAGAAAAVLRRESALSVAHRHASHAAGCALDVVVL